MDIDTIYLALSALIFIVVIAISRGTSKQYD
jgi:hypothetical protein